MILSTKEISEVENEVFTSQTAQKRIIQLLEAIEANTRP